MRVGDLNADYIDGKEYFIRLNQMEEYHPVRRAAQDRAFNLKVDPEGKKLYFKIRSIFHDRVGTSLAIEGTRVTLVLKHDWHIGME